MRKDKPDIEKKVIEFNSRLSKFCSKNKIDIIENENLDGSCLSFKKLHLNKKGNSYLANNFLDFLHSFWFGKSLPASPKTLVSSLEGLYNLRAFYPKNIILSYINVNSIRNKLDDLKFLLGKSLDIICISETKLDETFPTAQFAIEGFSKPYRLDITSNSGGLLFYVKANLPSKLIRFYNFPSEIQCIPIELNISTKKYALLSIYRPPNQNINFFLDKLSEAHDIYSKHYGNICIFGDFNATPENNDKITTKTLH